MQIQSPIDANDLARRYTSEMDIMQFELLPSKSKYSKHLLYQSKATVKFRVIESLI